jgi:hypothetical protein
VRALSDLQRGVRDALVLNEISEVESLLVGGRDARKRLAIHQRHYRTSLITALLDRFPATVWLVGSAPVTEAARAFVRERPPSRPCIAEYGEEFPAFLAAQHGAMEIPYLGPFAELEWHLSRLSLAIDVPPLAVADFSPVGAALGEATLSLQSGVHYTHAEWPIDELMSLYLSDSAPDQFRLEPGDLWLELRGARGTLRMLRLNHAEFTFREALVRGESLADAAISALDIDPAFEAGQALLNLVGDGLVIACDAPEPGGAA